MKKSMTRRSFLKNSVQVGAGAALAAGFPLADFGRIGKANACTGIPPKVIMVAIDGLDARALDLDRNGNHGGRPGNWLLPNVHEFLEGGAHFSNITCWLPSATDMNHLNAISGTHSGENGISMVSYQMMKWGSNGKAILGAPSLSRAKTGTGEQVDTLFNAWKRKWPQSRTFYTSGKEWVANMFNTREVDTGVDIIIGGLNHPDYIKGIGPLGGIKFYDPPSDNNPILDAESKEQIILSNVMRFKPKHFPPDRWIIDASLKMLRTEQPDFGVILLGQMDDLQHCLGECNNPDDFSRRFILGKGFVDQNKYLDCVYREPILDGIKDVDVEFGRLIDGIYGTPGYEDALIVLYSDHGFVTHRNVQTVLEIGITSLLDLHRIFKDTDVMHILYQAGVINDDEMNLTGFMPMMATSFGGLHFQGDTMVQRIQKAQKAKRALLDHRVWDTFSRSWECPWHVLDIGDMEKGLPGIAEPGELFHSYYGYYNGNEEGMVLWPDIFILAKNQWQLPAVAGLMTNLGVTLPPVLSDFLAPMSPLLGGHGSTDAQNTILGFKGAGIISREISQACRISDIATTMAAMLGLELRTDYMGNDLSGNLS